MCYAASCDPRCGKCRPKRLVEVACPSCGFTNSMSREEYLLFFDLPHRKNILEQKILERGGVPAPICSMCGEPLAEAFKAAIVPRECSLNRVVCGFPCGRSDEPYREGALSCPTMVPLSKVQ